MTLFEAQTGGAFDRLDWQHSGKFDQNVSRKSNAPRFARGGWAVFGIDRYIKFTFSQISRTDVPISRCCFVNFCKQQQRNKQKIITHAYTAMALVAVAVEVCLI